MRVEQLRGSWVEVVHEVHVAVVDSTGGLVARTGDPELVTFWRSAAKPFQALPLVEDGAVERFGLTTEELALVCASHSSEPGQVARVRDLLAKIGCAERDLLCGPHPPLSEAVAQEYATHGVRLTAVYSNCSGKHGDARAGPPSRLAHAVLHSARASRAAALPGGGEPLDGRARRSDQDGGGWLRGGVLWAAAEEHGGGVCETGKRGSRNAERGTAGGGRARHDVRQSVSRSAFRVPHCRSHAPPSRAHRRLRPPLHRDDARAPRARDRQGRRRGSVLRGAAAGGAGGRAQGRGRARTRGGARDGGGARGAGVEAPAGIARGAAQREHAGGDGGGAASKWRISAMKRWGSRVQGAVL